MDNETKELHIKEAVDYENIKGTVTGHIAVCTSLLGLTATTAIVSNMGLSHVPSSYLTDLIRILSNIALGGVSLTVIILMAKRLITRISANVSIKDIKKLFASHGLILDEELAKSKGIGM